MNHDSVSILEKIVAVKREEIAKLRPQAETLKQAAMARKDFRDFAGALFGGSRFRATKGTGGLAEARPSEKGKNVALIAEVKKASPSAGVICADFDPIRIAREYERAGASALSVLTDEKFFQGHLDYLKAIRSEVKLPLLRKDFIIDELQVYESVARGADAVLLIVAILDGAQLKAFSGLAKSLRIAALVEVHSEPELDRALAAGADIIGINNRDLRDFSVRLETTEKLCARIVGGSRSVATAEGNGLAGVRPSKRPLIVAESGINTRSDVERVARAGVDAILVGESLMKSGDTAAKVKELLE
jgi:indole-3-glycerol phosphate synthase